MTYVVAQEAANFFAPLRKHACTQVGRPDRVRFIRLDANPNVNARMKASKPSVAPTIVPTGASFSCSHRLRRNFPNRYPHATEIRTTPRMAIKRPQRGRASISALFSNTSSPDCNDLDGT